MRTRDRHAEQKGGGADPDEASTHVLTPPSAAELQGVFIS
jgi:hypothetical protein